MRPAHVALAVLVAAIWGLNFVVVEVGLAIFVRDNLTLNVLMLFFPLESLKDWQLHGWA